MKAKLKLCLPGLLLALIWQTAPAQRDQALLRELAEENKQSIEALVLYPEDVRLAILESTKEPALLVRIQSLRVKTSAAFRTLIEDYPRNEQERFYDLSRYPGLPGALAAAKDPAVLDNVVATLPEAERAGVADFARYNRSALQKIQDLYDTSTAAFDAMVKPYPAGLQQALRTLLNLPEVVDILNEDLRFAVMVGDLYREDPAWVIHKMDSLHLAVARTHAEEMEAWKKNLDEDPQARQELQEVARTYAAETYGYDGEDYPYGPYEYGPDVVAVDYVVFHPYPYWFGYPWWYTAPRWRPYPYWYDWGFYPYWDNWIVVSMPSYYFMHWYFDRPYYCYRYNYLSTRFVSHYYHYRRSGTTISVGVGEWRNRTRTIISDQWLSDQDRLPDRLKEYGRFEDGRQKFNDRHPGREQTREEYLDKNTKKYPQLADSRKVAREEMEKARTDAARKPSTWAPSKEPVRRDAPDVAKPAPKPERPARVPEVKQPPNLKKRRPLVRPDKNPTEKSFRLLKSRTMQRRLTKRRTITGKNGRSPSRPRPRRPNPTAGLRRLSKRPHPNRHRRPNKRLRLQKDLRVRIRKYGAVSAGGMSVMLYRRLFAVHGGKATKFCTVNIRIRPAGGPKR